MSRISNPGDVTVIGASPLPANGKTILIAEDDPFISRMYETKLKLSGYNVVLANNGRDAYEAIKATNPNLLLLDLNMPELSGFEVVNALTGDGYDFTNVPIMILTNSSIMADKKTAEKLGADYMVKAELTPRTVLERINNKLGVVTAGEKPPISL